MAKLKFDRIVRIVTRTQEKIIVPDDEVWKGTMGWNDNLYLNDITVADGSQNNRMAPNVILGGVLKSLENALLQGLRSKLLTKIFAKEVSLA